MIKENKKIKLLLLFFFCCGIAVAQQYKFKAEITPVTKTGFYKLDISPELSAYLKIDLADLRFVDDQDKFVPHIMQTFLPNFQENIFKEFPILKNEVDDSGRSVLILENKGLSLTINNKAITSIYEIVLFLKNSSVSRYASLSGSMDQTHWFAIAENVLLSKTYNTKENYFVNSISFNNVDYKYFRITINNQKADPLNIIKAGSYYNLVYQEFSPLRQNPHFSFSQNDSSNLKSYIKIQADKAYHIDQMTFNISAPKFYERNASIYLPANGEAPNSLSNNPALDISLSSKRENIFEIKTIKSKTFYLVIDNKDNPPLKIAGVSTKQHINSAVVYLEKDKKYFLLLDNDAAQKPDYDLGIFKDSIPYNIDTLSIGALMNIEKQKPTIQKDIANKWWLWSAIIAAILVLAWLTWKLVKDMKKNDV